MVSWVAETEKMLRFSFILVVFGLVLVSDAKEYNVLELDDSFLENRGDQAWLVMFFAPWCGHCKRLEPVWSQVDRYLKESESDVQVAKLDATRFPSVASHFDVRGYPTVKFIQGDRVLNYKGDRFRDNIVEFANRAHGPVIRWLSNTAKLQDVRSDLHNRVFFLYVGPEDETDPLYVVYEESARAQRINSYFYAGPKSILHWSFEKNYETTVLVFKDKKYYEYEAPEGGPTKESMEKFINTERMIAFPKMTAGGLNELTGLGKKIVLIVTKNRVEEDPKEERVKQLGSILSTQYRDNYHNHFQFIWMSDPDTGNTITMSRPETPYMLVWDMETNVYYLPDTDFDVHQMTIEGAHKFLDDVIQNKVLPRGGNSFKQRLIRFFYDVGVVVYSIYNESVWLALVVFGVPSVVISIICYALCCMETVDENEMYDELEQDDGMMEEAGEEEYEQDMSDARVQRRLPRDGHQKSE